MSRIDLSDVKIQTTTDRETWMRDYVDQSTAEGEGLTFDDFWQSLRAAIWFGMTTPLALMLLTRARELMDAYPMMAIVSGVVAFSASLFVRATESTRNDFVMLLRGLAYLVLGVQFLAFLVAIVFYIANKG